jgi:hypothetical protein
MYIYTGNQSTSPCSALRELYTLSFNLKDRVEAVLSRSAVAKALKPRLMAMNASSTALPSTDPTNDLTPMGTFQIPSAEEVNIYM